MKSKTNNRLYLFCQKVAWPSFNNQEKSEKCNFVNNLILKQHSSSDALVLSQDFSFLQSMIDFTKTFKEYMGINTRTLL